MSVTSLPRGVLTTARTSVFVVFAASGFAFSSWASRLPDIKRLLALTPGELGLLLLAVAAGSMVGLPVSGRVIKAVGTKRTVLFGATCGVLGVMAGAVLVDAARQPAPVWFAMFLAGLGIGIWDVAMNHEAAEVERGLGRAIMPWFHAAFSGCAFFFASVARATARTLPFTPGSSS